MSPAGEGPTAPAVSLGSLGVERGHGSGWGGEGPCRVDAEFFVLGLGYLVSVGSGEEAYLPDGTRGGGL